MSKGGLLLLTLFFGGFGAHKFYLGKYWQGALYFIFSWTCIPTLLAWVEFVIYAFTSSDQLNERYPAKGSVVVTTIVVLVGSIFFLAVVGLSVAIAIPAYQDYTKRANATEGIIMGRRLEARITEAFNRRSSDMSCSPESCLLGIAELGPTKVVRRVSSNRSGRIIIEFEEQLFPAGQNTLSLTPLINGVPADISDSANTGKVLTWKCGQDALTTVAPKHLPPSCR